MALGSCLKCLKYCVFIFNFIFWLMSCTLLGVGIYLRLDESASKIVQINESLEVYYTFCYVVIAVGAVMFVISFMGCCGAYQESMVLLAFFFALLVIVFLAEVAGGIVAYTKKDEIAAWFKTSLKDVVQKGYTGGNDVQSVAIDWIQQNFECCGSDDSTDWTGSHWMLQDVKRIVAVPDSCCRNMQDVVDYCSKFEVNLATNANIFYDGCGSKVVNFFREHFDAMIGGILGIAGIELLGMTASMLLFCGLQRVDMLD